MQARPRAVRRPGSSRWDLKKALLTGIAAAFVAAVMGVFLHGGPVLTVLAASVTGVVVGILAGYRPIHEPDSETAEEELLHHWVGD